VASDDKEDVKVVVRGDTAVTSYRFIVTIHNHGQETRRLFRTTNCLDEAAVRLADHGRAHRESRSHPRVTGR
jgi:predicted component of viral defense system (DUF524 family)